MNYVKLSQHQLKEIEELLDSKNNTIKMLTAELNSLRDSSVSKIKSELKFYKDDNKKLQEELNTSETKLYNALQTISKLEDTNTQIQSKYKDTKNELSIQISVNKAALKLLNKINSSTAFTEVCNEIPDADLTNILDIKA
jgi:chromosome segregation ATPase